MHVRYFIAVNLIGVLVIFLLTGKLPTETMMRTIGMCLAIALAVSIRLMHHYTHSYEKAGNSEEYIDDGE